MDHNTKSRQAWLAQLASGYRPVPRSSWRASIALAIIGITLLVLAVNYARADEIDAGAAAHMAVLEVRK